MNFHILWKHYFLTSFLHSVWVKRNTWALFLEKLGSNNLINISNNLVATWVNNCSILVESRTLFSFHFYIIIISYSWDTCTFWTWPTFSVIWNKIGYLHLYFCPHFLFCFDFGSWGRVSLHSPSFLPSNSLCPPCLASNPARWMLELQTYAITPGLTFAMYFITATFKI